MEFRERQISFRWRLRNPPERLWPYLADTNRFNSDVGLPAMITEGVDPEDPTVRLMRLKYLGTTIRWREFPFDWAAPERFGVNRSYTDGPLKNLRMQAVLEPAGHGTRLHYHIWFVPRNLVGFALAPLRIAIGQRRRFERAFRHYDDLAGTASAPDLHPLKQGKTRVFGARRRLRAMALRIAEKASADTTALDRLTEFLATADDLSLNRMRPFVLARLWDHPPDKTLDLFLHATREGLLNFSWEILCPLCRGAKATVASLRDLGSSAHCDTCNIKFDTNLDQVVELVFFPNPAIRKIEAHEFCVGGPQVTPHILAQQRLPPGHIVRWDLKGLTGRHRLRAPRGPAAHYLDLPPPEDTRDRGSVTLELVEDGWRATDAIQQEPGHLSVINGSSIPQLLLLEQVKWMDDAVTAALVTARQTFRDLFSSEVIPYGDQISVGRMTLVFTDLRGSTRLYESIGDAPAFGVVMNHFEVLKKHVQARHGTIVKTMGDAIMAGFVQPVEALQALLDAQYELAHPAGDVTSLALKAGIHIGPCIAINQDSRLDYFGTTVNVAARLEGLSCGEDLIVSSTFMEEPTVRTFLRENATQLQLETGSAEIKGIEAGPVSFTRIRPL